MKDLVLAFRYVADKYSRIQWVYMCWNLNLIRLIFFVQPDQKYLKATNRPAVLKRPSPSLVYEKDFLLPRCLSCADDITVLCRNRPLDIAFRAFWSNINGKSKEYKHLHRRCKYRFLWASANSTQTQGRLSESGNILPVISFKWDLNTSLQQRSLASMEQN